MMALVKENRLAHAFMKNCCTAASSTENGFVRPHATGHFGRPRLGAKAAAGRGRRAAQTASRDPAPRRRQLYIDETYLKVHGRWRYLYRAIDQHGALLDVLVQNRRDTASAKRFFRRLLQGPHDKSRQLLSDGLPSYGVMIPSSFVV
jgi:hypothetical protein